MSKSHRSSSASASCRIEWRPSRLIAAWLAALMLLAPFSVLASGMPRWLAWPLAIAAAVTAWGVRRRWCRMPKRSLLVRAEGPLSVDGELFPEWRLEWRGPLAFLHWRGADGRIAGLSFWPDTLPPALRRELRLASPPASAVSPGAGMAT